MGALVQFVTDPEKEHNMYNHHSLPNKGVGWIISCAFFLCVNVVGKVTDLRCLKSHLWLILSIPSAHTHTYTHVCTHSNTQCTQVGISLQRMTDTCVRTAIKGTGAVRSTVYRKLFALSPFHAEVRGGWRHSDLFAVPFLLTDKSSRPGGVNAVIKVCAQAE